MRSLHALRRDARAHVPDYALATAMVVAAVISLATRIDMGSGEAERFHFRPDTTWSWAATIVACLALVGRRRWPLPVFAVSVSLSVLLGATHHRDTVAFVAMLLATFTVAAHLPLRRSASAAGVAAVVIAVLMIVFSTDSLNGPVFMTGGFALGRMVYVRRARQERRIEIAIEQGAREVQTADLQAADERLQLAQELHDVVAHSLSVIAVQAGIGAHLIDRQPGEAAKALDSIRMTCDAADSELARLVEVLRDGDSGDRAEAPTLAEVDALVSQIRGAGVPITLTKEGDLSIVPAGVSLAAYRIVQEALTNMVRHAGRAEAWVVVRATGDRVELVIEDDGHGATSTTEVDRVGGGHGLVGMSERAEMYGGSVQTRVRPGGFRVRATLRYASGPTMNAAATAADVGSISGLPALPAMPAHRRIPPWVWDIGLAVVVGGFLVLQCLTAQKNPAGPFFTQVDAWAWLVGLGSCVPLAVRRRWPTLSFVTICTCAVVLAIGDYQVDVINFMLVIGIYTVGSYASTRRLIGSLSGLYLALALVAWSKPPDLTPANSVWVSFLFTGAAIAGYLAGRDGAHRDTDVAEREHLADARARGARLVIATERLRIADELSTVITHSIRTIAQHAAIGSAMVTADPVAARTTLETISSISRDALNDLRRLLKRIRTEAEPARYVPIAPVPGLATVGDA